MYEAYHSTVEQYPIAISRCEGNWIIGYSIKNRTDSRWLDFWNDEGVSSFGCSKNIKDAIISYVTHNRPIHIPKMYHSEELEYYANKLTSFAGLPDYKVMFSNSGTEANEVAIKAARLFYNGIDESNDKYEIYSWRRNFHGRTGFSLAASDSYGSGSPYHKDGFGPMPEGFYHFDKDDMGVMRMSQRIAGVMMATILGNNEIEVYTPELLIKIYEMTKDIDALLILDEIQVGMGRTGRNMAFHHYNNIGFKPDIVTVGKGMAGGLPLSATIMRPDVAEKFTYGTHFNTLGGSALAVAVSYTVLSEIERSIPRINEYGNYIRDSLSKLNWIEKVDGLGLHLSFTIDQDDFNLFDYSGIDFCREAINHGLLIVSHRPYGQIRFTPPLSINRSEIDYALKALVETRDEIVKRSIV